jgi:two-component system OmpR family response regulator
MCAARVLVVEDDPDIAALIQLHLESAHYQVRIATDGTQGLQLALSEPVDLGLPELDGLKLRRRHECKVPRPLVLMVTARSY